MKLVIDIDASLYEWLHYQIGVEEPWNTIQMAIVDGEPPEKEQKTGHWIEHPHETGENWEYSKYECSECHVWEDDDSDYCPNCGAKMESEKRYGDI